MSYHPGHTNYHADCPTCKRVNRTRCAASKAKRKARLARGEIELEHGTLDTARNYDCPCDECREVWNAYMQRTKADRKARGR